MRTVTDGTRDDFVTLDGYSTLVSDSSGINRGSLSPRELEMQRAASGGRVMSPIVRPSTPNAVGSHALYDVVHID